jgi:hypothetical protein
VCERHKVDDGGKGGEREEERGRERERKKTTYETVLARNDHDGTVRLGVDQALRHDIREVGLAVIVDSERRISFSSSEKSEKEKGSNAHFDVHDSPDDVRRISKHLDLALPLTVSRLSSRNRPPDQRAGSVNSEKVLRADSELLLGVGVVELGLDGVLLRLVGRAGVEFVGAEDTAVRGGGFDVGGKEGAALQGGKGQPAEQGAKERG